MEELVEKISRIIRDQFNKSLCAGELDTDKIAREILKYLLSSQKVNIPVPEGASGCCEIND